MPIDQRPVDHRVDMPCHTCGQFDRHPRHHHLDVDPTTGEPTYQIKHLDCCESDGCPNGQCSEDMTNSQRAHGDELATFLQAKEAPVQPDLEDPLDFLHNLVTQARADRDQEGGGDA